MDYYDYTDPAGNILTIRVEYLGARLTSSVMQTGKAITIEEFPEEHYEKLSSFIRANNLKAVSRNAA